MTEPSARRSPVGQAACQRQVRYWNAQSRVRAITRPLKYYGDIPREKGIDVLIALEMVLGAVRDEYDVAVLFSGDTDLAPAVEHVLDLGKRCEVASWQGRSDQRSRLSIPGRRLWCHWLNRHDYDMVEDSADYTRPQDEPPMADP